ncbi:ribosome biosynthesis protein [Martiniozyma asiatica (nom. inval.)]|nr:ribosome biosynthesis protein [Martiniozyma asiatica]
MSNSLEERIKQHSEAFSGLLSLIPSTLYYEKDTSNQWKEKQKRKSKEEHKQMKKQKLNPDESKNVSVKAVMDKNEETAKPVVLPGEKFKKRMQELEKASTKKISSNNDDDEEANGEVKESDNQNEILMGKGSLVFDDNGNTIGQSEVEKEERKKVTQAVQKAQKEKKNLDSSKKEVKPKKQLTQEEINEKERKQKELKAKLQAKIQNMREKRKAPGTKVPGAATSRQQILEERRKKAEIRKEKKKEIISDQESSSDDDDDENNNNKDADDDDDIAKSVMFSNIKFGENELVSSDMTSIRKIGKKKGPANNDLKAHLKIIEKEKQRLADMDKDSRAKEAEKHKWQKALAGIQGEKLKDDEKLLKKALRRKDSQKRKSEREWRDRKQLVADELKMKQDRREENLRIRKANKGKGKKQQVKQLPSYKRSRANKKLAGTKRAGFEGGVKSGKMNKK